MSIEVVEVKANAAMGASLSDCLRASILLAVKEWRNVSVTHNNVEYKINVNSIMSIVTNGGKDE